MPRYSIAFIAPSQSSQLRHKIIESDNKDGALRRFFSEETSEFYSNDEQGYFYFKEDFYDDITKSGSMLECE